ncbi:MULTISPECIES: lanthionine synthetase C family protein [Clostridium]|uniref:lanthionine synthetase C family protein n=1 Tax=Clostridium TaxID=1485 RepID=UPI00082608AC|nr:MULTISPECIES: lanthionine synthetase C family protein [Clostridium]
MYSGEVNDLIREFSKLIIDVDMFEDKIEKCKTWNVFFLCSGYPEIIFYILEARELNNDLNWNKALKEYIKRFRSNLYVSEPYLNQGSGILNGYCGIGYMLLYLSKYGVNVEKALNSVNRRVKIVLEKKLESAKNNIKSNKVHYSDYDVIEGLSSSLRYLLEFKNLSIFKDLINEIISYLIEITKTNNSKYPNYYIRADKVRDSGRSKRCPNGFVDFGAAHGIAGILSVLSIALSNRIKVEGIEKSIETLLNKFNQFMIVDGKISYWPGILGIEDYLNNTKGVNYNKYGWCYGTSGITRAIYLAGQALDEKKYKDVAINILSDFCRNINNADVNGYSLCHGYSSILLVLNEMYADTDVGLFKETSDIIADKIVKDIRMDEILNFKEDKVNLAQNNIGILDGIIGIIFSLINYSDKNRNLVSKIMCIK